MARLCTAVLLSLMLRGGADAAAPAPAAVHPCGGGAATLIPRGSGCEVWPNRTVSLRTQWSVPAAAQDVPLKIEVAGVVSFPLSGCGRHTTRIEGGLVEVQVDGFPCPLPPGNRSLAMLVSLPSWVPHGTFTITVQGDPLLCAAVSVHL